MTRDPAVADLLSTLQATFRRARSLTRRAQYLARAIERTAVPVLPAGTRSYSPAGGTGELRSPDCVSLILST